MLGVEVPLRVQRCRQGVPPRPDLHVVRDQRRTVQQRLPGHAQARAPLGNLMPLGGGSRVFRVLRVCAVSYGWWVCNIPAWWQEYERFGRHCLALTPLRRPGSKCARSTLGPSPYPKPSPCTFPHVMPPSPLPSPLPSPSTRYRCAQSAARLGRRMGHREPEEGEGGRGRRLSPPLTTTTGHNNTCSSWIEGAHRRLGATPPQEQEKRVGGKPTWRRRCRARGE